MRILLINYSEIKNPGGVHKTIRELAKNLTIMRHEVIVLQTNPQNLPKEELYDGYKIIRINSPLSKYFYGLSLRTFIFLRHTIDKINPDIIHVHGYHTLYSLETIYALKNIKCPIIFSPHLDTERSTIIGKYFWNVYNVLLGRGLFKQVDSIIACSNYEGQVIASIFNIDLVKISVIPHGVNNIDIMIHNSKNNVKINLLYSGHLIYRKNVSSIIESLHELVYYYNYNNVILKINGIGPEKEKLLKLSHTLNVDKYILWNDFLSRDEYNKTLSESDIFILLSRSEAFGITIAEALSCGTPCIVTNVTALEEFINEPGCFFVDYPPNPKIVAQLIINIINNGANVGPLSNRIRVWGDVVKDYEKVYIRILK